MSPLRHNSMIEVFFVCHIEYVLVVTRLIPNVHIYVKIQAVNYCYAFFLIFLCLFYSDISDLKKRCCSTAQPYVQLPSESLNKCINYLFETISLSLFINLIKTNALFFFLSDRVIKIWRLFPFAEEALAPLMTLYCHETPRLLSVAHHKLCAAFHEPSTASYNIVVFKTTQKSR